MKLGPKGDGSIEPAVLKRWPDLASWISINGHARHGTRPVESSAPGTVV